ncbi:MAG: pilus assembly protein PilP, partial [Desulfobacterium sp.]|nr:pilus assembly protein PilP [Desulfobacterium sp.]
EEPKAAIAEEPKAAIAEEPKAAIAEEPKAAIAEKLTPKGAAPTGKPEPQGKPVVSDPDEPQFYSSKGKIDPFLPLIQTEQKAVSGAAAKEEKPQRVLTPLERLDLSQIRLVAVVIAESGNIAMVEETSGKGYVVRIGTYMGKNGGRVEKILRDRIVINEIVKNFRGDAVPRSSEMKLHKPEIEG